MAGILSQECPSLGPMVGILSQEYPSLGPMAGIFGQECPPLAPKMAKNAGNRPFQTFCRYFAESNSRLVAQPIRVIFRGIAKTAHGSICSGEACLTQPGPSAHSVLIASGVVFFNGTLHIFLLLPVF